MNDDAAVFAPAGLSLSNAAGAIADGIAKMPLDGGLIVDMENMQHCDSAAICLLIEMFRNGQKKNCRIEVRNIGEQLKKMMHLYRLTELLASDKAVGTSETAAPAPGEKTET